MDSKNNLFYILLKNSRRDKDGNENNFRNKNKGGLDPSPFGCFSKEGMESKAAKGGKWQSDKNVTKQIEQKRLGQTILFDSIVALDFSHSPTFLTLSLSLSLYLLLLFIYLFIFFF